jgi:hypothetical protein
MGILLIHNLAFPGEGNNPETSIGIMHSRENSEHKSQKIEQSQVGERYFEGVEEKNKGQNRELTDCACFSQEGGRKAFLTSQFVEGESTGDDEQVTADNDYRQPKRDDVGRVERWNGQNDKGRGHE